MAARILALIVLAVFAVPAVSLALPALAGSPNGSMSGGCHGQPEPMPVPSHSCCYALPQAPAPVQLAPSLTSLAPIVCDGDVLLVTFMTIASPARADSSSPPVFVLRI